MASPLRLPLVLGMTMASAVAHAGILEFLLEGKAGFGLLPGNETGAVTGDPPGTGGLLPGGITYDTETRLLSFNIGWGSGNGFTDLTGDATVAHIHGIVPGDDPFNANAGVLYDTHSGLGAGWNPSATDGFAIGSVTLTEAHETALLEHRLYFNVHTTLNAPGEIRGNLVVVPEPHENALALAGAALAWAGYRRLRRPTRSTT
ncbi:MAG: CHRD domain-containing protein [Verrucomicrobiae bacterium]|nr:CHRD domain-containing protein [Verrucomicrobiae bacterium]